MTTVSRSVRRPGTPSPDGNGASPPRAEASDGDAEEVAEHSGETPLFDGVFPEYRHPVLVQKMEEPGSKQKLAFQHNRVTSLCYDLVNHLINDIAVMGAAPLAVQDVIICGKHTTSSPSTPPSNPSGRSSLMHPPWR